MRRSSKRGRIIAGDLATGRELRWNNATGTVEVADLESGAVVDSITLARLFTELRIPQADIVAASHEIYARNLRSKGTRTYWVPFG